MGRTQYIGARYVPIFADPEEWNNTRTYEALTVVLHNGDSYTSKQAVPVGIDISNTEFWAHTGNYNAQIEQYRQDTLSKAFAFNTVELMTQADNLFVGAICHTNGFHASGDGGAAWYLISSTLPEGMEEANGMDVIGIPESAPALFANLVVTGDYVTPEMFGAYGDGVNDDTQAIVNAFKNNLVVFPANKVYNVKTNEIEIENDLCVIGCGSTINVIEQCEAAINICPNVDNLSIRFYDLNVECNRKAATGILIRHKRDSADVNYSLNIEIDNCSFSNMQNYSTTLGTTGIFIYSGTKNVKISNCVFDSVYKAISNDAVIAHRFITIDNSKNAIVENCYFGDMFNLSDNNLDCDCIAINNTSIDEDEYMLFVNNCRFNSTFTRILKIIGCSAVFENNIVNLGNSSALSYVVDSQSYSCVIEGNEINVNGVIGTSVRLFDLATGENIISGNNIKFVNVTSPEYANLAKRTKSDFTLRVENNTIDSDEIGYFVRSAIDNTVSGIVVFNNNIVNVTGLTYFNNWTTLENIVIRMTNNYSKAINKRYCIQTTANKLKSIFLDNNNLRCDLLFDELDCSKMNNCKFVNNNTTILNPPSGMDVSSPVGAELVITPNNANNIVRYSKGSYYFMGTVARS